MRPPQPRIEAGQHEDAIRLWREALKEMPSYRPAYEALKRLYAERKDDEGLLWVLETGLDAVRHAKTHILDLISRADLKWKAERTSEALDDLDRILKE